MELNIKELLGEENPEQAILDAVEAHVEGLKRKNSELLGEQKKLKGELVDLNGKVEELATREEQRAEETALRQGDVGAIRQQLSEKHQRELTELSADRDALKAQMDALVVDGGLSAQLSRIGVAVPYAEAVKALLKARSGFAVEMLEGQPTAMAGGETLAEFVDAWAETDEARHYIAARDNSGSSLGNGMPSPGREGVDNPWDPACRNITQQMLLARENPELARQMAAEYGIRLSF